MDVANKTNPLSPTARTKARTRLAPPETADVVLIGCGLGGLTTAAYLSQLGYKVACFDHHYVAGGCATAFTRGPARARYHFDVGLHYIGDCGEDGAIPSVLREVGAKVDFVPMDPDGFDTLIFPDFTFRIPVDRGLYRDRLVALFPEERRGIDRYIRFLNEIEGLVDRMTFPGKVTPLAFGWFALTRGRLGAMWSEKTLTQFLDSCTNNMQLKAVLSGQNGDYGVAPHKVVAGLHAGVSNHYFKGAYYPRGGGQALADQLAARIEDNGSSIHLRCGIEKILVEGGRAVGVRTSEGRHGIREIRAKVVISNADITRTYTELLGPEHLSKKWLTKINNFEMAEALFITYLGVTADMSAKGMRAANYWQFDDYDFDATYRAGESGDDVRSTAAYITSATLKEEGASYHAPEGVTSLEVMTLVPGSPQRWGLKSGSLDRWDYKNCTAYLERKQRIEDEMITRLEAVFPGTAETIVFRESATPLTQSRYTRSLGGTSYGLAATAKQFQAKRPGYRGPIQGLYLTGANTKAGHGIYGVMLGGRASAQVVSRDLGSSSFPGAPQTSGS
jgi:phytoene dehydrogenase-like protein